MRGCGQTDLEVALGFLDGDAAVVRARVELLAHGRGDNVLVVADALDKDGLGKADRRAREL